MRSLLYCPANSPKMLTHVGIYGADAIVFDLEDAVTEDEKDEARDLLVEYLSHMDYGEAELIVRINSFDSVYGKADLQAMIPLHKAIIRIPKVETAAEIRHTEAYVQELEKQYSLTPGSTKFHILLETPLGIERAFSLAGASDRIAALAFGAEDYCRATGIKRIGEPYALDYVRSRLVSAAGAYGIACFDSVWGVLSDSEGLEKESHRSRTLGFNGKSVIHPDQVAIVNRIFSFSEEEILWARRILHEAANGVSEVDGRMVDVPVIAQARRIINESGEEST